MLFAIDASLGWQCTCKRCISDASGTIGA
jgi:hypothetical protein